MKNGIIQIYCGDGKGKTTAAVGQAVRSKASGLNILFIFFNKMKSANCGECSILEDIGIKTKFFATRHPKFYPDITNEKMRRETLKGLEYTLQAFNENGYDIIILDEILISARDGFISEQEVIELMEKKPTNTELILTGRGATENIKNAADLVSEVKNIKHPYQQGFGWRTGIEK